MISVGKSCARQATGAISGGLLHFLDSLGVIVNEPELPGRPRRICQLELRQIQLMQENLISQVQIIRTDEVLAGQLADVYL